MRASTLGIFALMAVLHQDPQKGTLRVTVSLVTVGVRVTDSKGREVGGLRAEDFSISENGQLQKISFFSSESQPHSLGMLLDKAGA